MRPAAGNPQAACLAQLQLLYVMSRNNTEHLMSTNESLYVMSLPVYSQHFKFKHNTQLKDNLAEQCPVEEQKEKR